MSTTQDIFGFPKISDFGPRGVSARIELSPGGSTNLHMVQLTGSASANTQFDLSLDDNVFVTVYGDKLTTMQVTGVSFPEDVLCNGSASDIAGYYQQYKARRGGTTKISVGFNNQVFSGLLTDMQVAPYNLQSVDALAITLVITGRFAS